MLSQSVRSDRESQAQLTAMKRSGYFITNRGCHRINIPGAERIRVAESLRSSPETIMTLFIGYMPIQN